MRFRTSYDDEIKQRSIWYYCPQALSEYKVPFLDIAKKQGVLDSLRPKAEFPDDGCAILSSVDTCDPAIRGRLRSGHRET